jgi:long-chain acyl-CoA synthetase
VALDGRERATIEGDAFNRALTRVWLGDHPAQASLKAAMLGTGAN